MEAAADDGRMLRTMPRPTAACTSAPSSPASRLQSACSRDGGADTRATAAPAGSTSASARQTLDGTGAVVSERADQLSLRAHRVIIATQPREEQCAIAGVERSGERAIHHFERER